MEPNFNHLNTPGNNLHGRNVQPTMSWLDKQLPNINELTKTKSNLSNTANIDYSKKSIKIREWLNNPKKKLIVIYVCQALLCLLLTLIVVALLYIFNPPITSSDGKQNSLYVSIFAILVFVFSFGIPECIRWIKY